MLDGIGAKIESFRKAVLPQQKPSQKPPEKEAEQPSKADRLELNKKNAGKLSNIGLAVAPYVASPMRVGNKVELYVNGSQAYPEMEKLIQGAQKRIEMEFFTFHDDEGGHKIANLLIEKAKSGVRVNLLVDLLSNVSNREILDEMEAAGVRVQRFANGHEAPILSPSNITDHRKILLVDGQSAMTGGMNIGTRYEKYWHDFMVKEQGPTLADIYDRFKKNWALSGGGKLRPIELNTKPQGTQAAQVAVTSPTEREIADSMLTAIRNAKDRIYIASPYFLDQDLVDALKQAAKRGVQVNAIIPTVGDNTWVNYLNEYVTNELLDAGVKVSLYDTLNEEVGRHDHVTDHFDHGKVMTVDGVWSSIGTANADPRSQVKNQEINLNVDDPAFAKEIEDRIFKQDLATRAKPAAKTDVSGLEVPLKEVLETLKPLF